MLPGDLIRKQLERPLMVRVSPRKAYSRRNGDRVRHSRGNNNSAEQGEEHGSTNESAHQSSLAADDAEVRRESLRYE